MKSELLKQITGYPEYWVSTIGNVYSTKRGGMRKLKPVKEKYGYLTVSLVKNTKGKTFKIHRLVAEAFLPNPKKLPQVNHKNEDKTDNRVSNLEWCTAEYNTNYGTRNERISELKSKTTYQYTLDGTLVREWSSINEIKKQTGWNTGNIWSCCVGKRKTAYRYRWSYAKV